MRDLRTYFPISSGVLARTVGYVKAVDGVSFDVHAGKTLGLVGESGCGKTTVGRTILRLIPATGGEVRYKGEDFFAYHGEELRRLRRQMQIIFQDPVSSLNPRMTVGNIIGEPIEVHGIAQGRQKDEMVASLLQRVGLDPVYAAPLPARILRRPAAAHRHRPRALRSIPDFIVCDEPVSALDVSIQSQILNLLDDLQTRAEHRVPVHRAQPRRRRAFLRRSGGDVPRPDRREGDRAASCTRIRSTRTRWRCSRAVPEPDPRPKRQRIVLQGEVPSAPAIRRRGCPFHPRCPLTRQAAAEAAAADTVADHHRRRERSASCENASNEIPPLEQKQGEPGHVAACWVTK